MFGWCPVGGSGQLGMLSGGADGERVEVVGEDRPGGPGAGALVAFQTGSAQAVAAFEVADAALGADPEPGESPVGLARAGRLASGDERSVWGRQVLGDGAGG